MLAVAAWPLCCHLQRSLPYDRLQLLAGRHNANRVPCIPEVTAQQGSTESTHMQAFKQPLSLLLVAVLLSAFAVSCSAWLMQIQFSQLLLKTLSCMLLRLRTWHH